MNCPMVVLVCDLSILSVVTMVANAQNENRVHCTYPTMRQDGVKGQRYSTATSQNWMDMWEARRRQELLQEARRCDKQLHVVSTSGPKTSEQVECTFNRLMLQDRVHSAVRLLTKRGGGGILDPWQEAQWKTGTLGRSVFEILQAKHPDQRPADSNTVLECEDLPPLEQVAITSVHIENCCQATERYV